MRGAFLRAAKSLEDKGRPLSTIIEEMLLERPKDALDAISKFVPKEMLIEATVVQQLEEFSDEALEREIGRLVREATPLLAASRTEESAKH